MVSEQGDGTLAHAERRDLLLLARAAIEDALTEQGALERALASVSLTPALRAPRAVFVTLHAAGKLRGCIGTVEAREPLFRSVIERAADAALRDPRFTRLTADELAQVDIEVSALTPARPVAGPAEIVCGRDGVELTRDGRRAVFLPQVAAEQGWGVTELLRELARKAGLPGDDIAGAKLSVFAAEVFGERDLQRENTRTY